MRLPQLHRAIMAAETLTPRFRRNLRAISENALPLEFQCLPAIFTPYAPSQYKAMMDGVLSMPANAVSLLFTDENADLLVFAKLRDQVILDLIGMYFLRGKLAMAVEVVLLSGPSMIEEAIIGGDDIFVQPGELSDEITTGFAWSSVNVLLATIGAMNEGAVSFRTIAARPAKARRDPPAPHWRREHLRRLPTGKTAYVKKALIRAAALTTFH